MGGSICSIGSIVGGSIPQPANLAHLHLIQSAAPRGVGWGEEGAPAAPSLYH